MIQPVFIEFLSNDYSKLLATYEAILKNGNLVFTIGSNVTETYKRINFQVPTTSPAIKPALTRTIIPVCLA